jgi:nicotinamidase-related amidase
MLLNRARSQLLVVDVQERLMPAMHEGERMIDKCAILIQAASRLRIPVTVSEQYRKGLGGTVGRLDNLKGDAPVMEKMHFSCAADAQITARVKAVVRPQVVVCGIESHVCVLQSALGFKDMGLDVVLVADAVTSRAQSSVDLALARARAAGVAIVNTEMALFEWLHESGTPEFKELSKLIK